MKFVDNSINAYDKLLVLKGIVPDDAILVIYEFKKYVEIVVHDNNNQEFMDRVVDIVDKRSRRKREYLLDQVFMMCGLDVDGDTIPMYKWQQAVDFVIDNYKFSDRVSRFFTRLRFRIKQFLSLRLR